MPLLVLPQHTTMGWEAGEKRREEKEMDGIDTGRAQVVAGPRNRGEVPLIRD